MRVLVTGCRGMVGSEVVKVLEARGHEAIPVSRQELDISDPESVAQIAVGQFGKLDWVLNAAAYTAVDRAESEPQQAYEVNGLGVAYLASACSQASVRLLHISTDFVFDGTARNPTKEDEGPKPLGSYGRSKLAGEQALAGRPNAILVRTSWVFGPQGSSFPRSILKAHREGKPLRVVSDQMGCPTYAPDLATTLVDLIEKDPFPGNYHAVGPEAMSWYEFAKLTLQICTGEEVEVTPIKTEDWPTPAKRPAYSVLSTERLAALGISPMRPIREALAEFCERSTVQG